MATKAFKEISIRIHDVRYYDLEALRVKKYLWKSLRDHSEEFLLYGVEVPMGQDIMMKKDRSKIDHFKPKSRARVAESLHYMRNPLMVFASYHHEAKLSPDVVLEAILLFILQLHAIHATRRYRNDCKMLSDQLSSTRQ